MRQNEICWLKGSGSLGCRKVIAKEEKSRENSDYCGVYSLYSFKINSGSYFVKVEQRIYMEYIRNELNKHFNLL